MIEATQARPLNRLNLSGMLQKQNGKFVNIDFVKNDGQPRSLNGRLGVVSLSKGGPNKVATDERTYITVFDAQAMGYRTVNLATVKKVKAQGLVFDIVD